MMLYFLLYKSNRTIQMVFDKFAEKGDTIGCRPVNNPWQPEVCWRSVFLVQFRNYILYTGNYFVSSAKQNIQVMHILK